MDGHSLRVTFAADVIVNGGGGYVRMPYPATAPDRKTLKELFGHKTLAMTMNLYAKIHRGTTSSGGGYVRMPYPATAPGQPPAVV